MLKNRDVDSNPYRVPPQPTSIWVKVAISLLTLLLLSTMGGVLYLMLVRMDCPCSVKTSVSNKKHFNNQEMADQSDIAGKSGENDLLRNLNDNVIGLDNDLAQVKRKVAQVEYYYRKSLQRSSEASSSGTSGSTSTSDSNLLQKVNQIESYARGLERKLGKHIDSEKKICQEGHWRHGVYCYVIMDASLRQPEAKEWCGEWRNQEGEASLAIIKDQFTQDFIASKLTERQNSYWIGIERHRSSSPLTSSQITASTTGIAPSSVRSSDAYFYSDGTRVQRGVWNMWGTSRSSGAIKKQRDCAAMTFNHVLDEWRWEERSCNDDLSYICQYYIMTTQ